MKKGFILKNNQTNIKIKNISNFNNKNGFSIIFSFNIIKLNERKISENFFDNNFYNNFYDESEENNKTQNSNNFQDENIINLIEIFDTNFKEKNILKFFIKNNQLFIKISDYFFPSHEIASININFNEFNIVYFAINVQKEIIININNVNFMVLENDKNLIDFPFNSKQNSIEMNVFNNINNNNDEFYSVIFGDVVLINDFLNSDEIEDLNQLKGNYNNILIQNFSDFNQKNIKKNHNLIENFNNIFNKKIQNKFFSIFYNNNNNNINFNGKIQKFSFDFSYNNFFNFDGIRFLINILKNIQKISKENEKIIYLFNNIITLIDLILTNNLFLKNKRFFNNNNNNNKNNNKIDIENTIDFYSHEIYFLFKSLFEYFHTIDIKNNNELINNNNNKILSSLLNTLSILNSLIEYDNFILFLRNKFISFLICFKFNVSNNNKIFQAIINSLNINDNGLTNEDFLIILLQNFNVDYDFVYDNNNNNNNNFIYYYNLIELIIEKNKKDNFWKIIKSICENIDIKIKEFDDDENNNNNNNNNKNIKIKNIYNLIVIIYKYLNTYFLSENINNENDKNNLKIAKKTFIKNIKDVKIYNENDNIIHNENNNEKNNNHHSFNNNNKKRRNSHSSNNSIININNSNNENNKENENNENHINFINKFLLDTTINLNIIKINNNNNNDLKNIINDSISILIQFLSFNNKFNASIIKNFTSPINIKTKNNNNNKILIINDKKTFISFYYLVYKKLNYKNFFKFMNGEYFLINFTLDYNDEILHKFNFLLKIYQNILNNENFELINLIKKFFTSFIFKILNDFMSITMIKDNKNNKIINEFVNNNNYLLKYYKNYFFDKNNIERDYDVFYNEIYALFNIFFDSFDNNNNNKINVYNNIIIKLLFYFFNSNNKILEEKKFVVKIFNNLNINANKYLNNNDNNKILINNKKIILIIFIYKIISLLKTNENIIKNFDYFQFFILNTNLIYNKENISFLILKKIIFNENNTKYLIEIIIEIYLELFIISNDIKYIQIINNFILIKPENKDTIFYFYDKNNMKKFKKNDENIIFVIYYFIKFSLLILNDNNNNKEFNSFCNNIKKILLNEILLIKKKFNLKKYFNNNNINNNLYLRILKFFMKDKNKENIENYLLKKVKKLKYKNDVLNYFKYNFDINENIILNENIFDIINNK